MEPPSIGESIFIGLFAWYVTHLIFDEIERLFVILERWAENSCRYHPRLGAISVTSDVGRLSLRPRHQGTGCMSLRAESKEPRRRRLMAEEQRPPAINLLLSEKLMHNYDALPNGVRYQAGQQNDAYVFAVVVPKAQADKMSPETREKFRASLMPLAQELDGTFGDKKAATGDGTEGEKPASGADVTVKTTPPTKPAA